MKKYCKDFKVVENTSLTSSFFRLILELDEKLPEINPGQFVEILINNEKDVFLRRPLSIHDVYEDKNQILILVQIVGKGTLALSKVKVGEYLNMVFPLGKGFPLEGEKVLLIGGGCGVAPLMHLSRAFNNIGIKPHTLIGCKTQDQLFSTQEYSSLSTLHIATEDGSCGIKGMVTDHPIFKEDFDVIYTCGPTPMMKAISKESKKKNIPCYVSLENTMACGIGACLCCVVDTNEGHKCTCTEGPVFLSEDLKDF